MVNKKGRPRKNPDASMSELASVEEEYKKETIAELANSFSGMGDPGGLYSYPGSFGSNYGLNWNKNITMPTLPGTSKLSTPKPDDFKTQMIWAREMRDVKLIHGPLLRRRKFIVSGFRHRHADPKVVKLFNMLAKKSKLKQRLKDIAGELQTVGWVVVMPDMINLIPKDIHLLQDGVENERVFGQDNPYLRLDALSVDKIRENIDHFPDFIVKAVMDPQFNERLPLNDCFFLCAPRAINSPFPRAPLFPLFEPLKVIENLIETQFAISFAMKQLLMHVKVKGQVINGIEKPPSMTQLKNVFRQVSDGSRTSTIITPDSVTIEFLSPDKSIFEAATVPYEKAMERINKNIGIPMILVDGDAEGASFSSAVYVIKGFLQDVMDDREILLDEFVYPWYELKAAELYESNPKKYAYLWNEEEQEYNIPEVIFDETELKNMIELLNILKFKWQTGIYSGQDITEGFQDDYELIKARKEQFNADCDFVYMPFEPSQGLSRNVEDVYTQPNPNLIAPDGKAMDQKDVMDEQQSNNIDTINQQQKNNLDSINQQHDNNLELQDDQHKKNLKMQTANNAQTNTNPPIPGSKSPASVKAAKKPAGAAGRPSKGGSPRADSVDRAPRSGGTSAKGVSPQAKASSDDNLSTEDYLKILDSNIAKMQDHLSKIDDN